jgi:cell division protein FtsQ
MWASLIASAPSIARGSRRSRRRSAGRRSGLAVADVLRAGGGAMARSPRLRRTVAIAVVSLFLLVLGWWWLRDSSLVGIQQVKILGVRGPETGLIQSRLAETARGMTTMDLDTGRLKQAIAPYTVVAQLTATTHFPHGITIDVVQRLPAAILAGPGGPIMVAGDGTLLRGFVAPASVPVLNVPSVPAGAAVTDRHLLERINLLGAAPDPLLARVDRVFVGRRGLEAVLRNGPTVYFGDATRPAAKWSAAARVLADPGSAGAAYVDVRIPDRPAAEVPGAASFTIAGAAASSSPTASTTAGPGLTGVVPGVGAGAGPGTGSGAGPGTGAATAAGTSTGTGTVTSAGTGSGTSSNTTQGGVNGP